MSTETATKVRISDTDFVRALLSSKSYTELATTLNMAQASVQARANRLRKAGVELPAYDRKKKEIDVTGLNGLIAVTTQG